MQRLDDVFIKVKGGLITKDEGAREMMGIVYENTKAFGLSNLSEDDLMDFLIYQLKQFLHILEIFDPEKSQFTTFVKNNIQTNLGSWRKMAARRCFRRELYFTTAESEMESENFSIDQCTSEEDTSHDEKYYHTLVDVIKFTESQQDILKNFKSIGNSHRVNHQANFNKTMELRKNCILVLALKSCYYIDEDMMRKVSIITGTPYEVLNAMICKAIESLGSKIKRRNACARSRDNAYFFKKRYSFEMQRIDPDSSWAQVVNSKLIQHSQTWEKKNLLLMGNKFRITPTNKLIGEILGMEDRHVGHLIKVAEKNMDTISLKGYYDEHEDLLSHRKHE